MTPQIPGYLLAFESALRPLVAAIARMEAPARSRYVTAGALSVALIAWLAVAEYLGAANTYFATSDRSVPTILFGLFIPMIAAAIAPAHARRYERSQAQPSDDPKESFHYCFKPYQEAIRIAGLLRISARRDTGQPVGVRDPGGLEIPPTRSLPRRAAGEGLRGCLRRKVLDRPPPS